jgi:hypothetical protein
MIRPGTGHFSDYCRHRHFAWCARRFPMPSFAAQYYQQLFTGESYIAVNMKYLMLSVAAFILLAVAGCMSSFKHTVYSDGFDFPSENVKKIVAGKTTGKELIQMFGGPFEKYGISDEEEQWVYFYSTGTKFTVKSLLTDKVQSIGQHKTLSIRLKNGTITNFSYSESSEPIDSERAQ